jgi:hypothetical protein
MFPLRKKVIDLTPAFEPVPLAQTKLLSHDHKIKN